MAANKYAVLQGTKIGSDTLGGSTFVDIAGVDSIDEMPRLVYDETDTTRIDQADDIKQFAPTTADPGNLKAKLGFDKALVATFYGYGKTARSWRLTFADGSKLTFDGWRKEIGPEAEAGGEVLVDVVIRVTGNTTFTAAP
jgi:hypothetical protein